jgi:hypothetical protein
MAAPSPPSSRSLRLRTLLVGGAALALWFAMLWFMFGDVL